MSINKDHSKEPWRYVPEGDDTYHHIVSSDPIPYTVAVEKHCDKKTYRNYRRIVACVNACTKIPTETLEFINRIENRTVDFLEMAELKKVTDQRDDILIALKAARRNARIMHTTEQHETVCIPPELWQELCRVVDIVEQKKS